MEHIDAATLLDGLEGKLSEEEKIAFKRHIATCSKCQEALSSYASLLDALSKPALQDAPEATVKKAFALFEGKPSKVSTVVDVIKTLIQDSWSGEAAMGLRGELATRQIGMSADNYDLHLSIDYANANIRGQLLARNAQGFIPAFEARISTESGAELDANSSDEFGEFFLTNAGSASILTLELNDGSCLRFEVPTGEQK